MEQSGRYAALNKRLKTLDGLIKKNSKRPKKKATTNHIDNIFETYGAVKEKPVTMRSKRTSVKVRRRTINNLAIQLDQDAIEN